MHEAGLASFRGSFTIYYLYDLGLDVKQRALEAKQSLAKTARGTEEHSLQFGRVAAFSEVIAIMQQNATGFGISLSDLRLDDIDPDRDLFRWRGRARPADVEPLSCARESRRARLMVRRNPEKDEFSKNY